MVLKDGSKMSKSKGNTVDPQAMIDRYGADTVRLFIMFTSPPRDSLEWSDAGVDGAFRFIKRLWRIVGEFVDAGIDVDDLNTATLSDAQRTMRLKTHQTIAKVSDDVGRRYTFNTAIAAVMELLNEVTKFTDNSAQGRAIIKEALDNAVLLLSPIVPHTTHQLWKVLGYSGAPVDARWPAVDERALQQDTLQLIVQVNGKLRARVTVAASADQSTCQAVALQDENVIRHIRGKTVRKVIVVPGKLVNIVV